MNPHGSGMVDVTGKEPVLRTAEASGVIVLRASTIEAIKAGRVKKGDVLSTARIAAIMAVKNTPQAIPMCHQIPITGVDVGFDLHEGSIDVSVVVTTVAKTGVEMEALSGVSVALLNIWDMVKYLEKDETGNYPDTQIGCIRVVEKRKGGS